jgi:hypothetical protein
MRMQFRAIVKNAKKGETGGSSVHMLSLPISLPKLRMTVRKLSQAHGVTTKPFHPLLTRI